MKIGKLALAAQCTVMEQPASHCGGVSQVLDEHIVHVETRIAELTQLKQQLGELRQRCQQERAMEICGILQGLASMEPEAQPEKRTHLGVRKTRHSSHLLSPLRPCC